MNENLMHLKVRGVALWLNTLLGRESPAVIKEAIDTLLETADVLARASIAAKQSAESVAYRWQGHEGIWNVAIAYRFAEEAKSRGYEVEPLYATPPSPTAEQSAEPHVFGVVCRHGIPYAYNGGHGCGKGCVPPTAVEAPSLPPRELMQRALSFYETCPDGQYDLDVVVPLLLAALASPTAGDPE